MQLRNKKTGEVNYGDLHLDDFNSLAELNEEWEDYEEPKTFWYMTAWGDVKEYSQDQFAIKQKQEIGNYFETKEEAEQVVKKLRAWKRLKDKGFRFTHWKCTGSTSFTFDNYCGDGQPMSASDDLDLLFGGEE